MNGSDLQALIDGPRSDQYATPIGTPLSELDDHRLPRGMDVNITEVTRPNSPDLTRGNTLRSTMDGPRASVQLQTVQTLLVPHQVSDFAIVDDEERQPDTTTTPQRSTEAGYGGQAKLDRRHSARSSGDSSRSVSPPNSVDAFANPKRRERAGTFTTNCPSELQLALQTSVSAAPRSRRPTFDEPREPHQADDAASARSRAEADVCFPALEDEMRQSDIDYEELDEFVAEAGQMTKTPIVNNNLAGRRSGSPIAQCRKTFPDLRVKPTSSVYIEALMEFSPIIGGASGEGQEKIESTVEDDVPGLRQDGQKSGPMTGSSSRWTFFSSNLDNSVHSAELGGLLLPGETFRDIFELGRDSGLWWLDVCSATEEEVTAICKAFRVHPLTKEDILTQEPREKVELFKAYYFVCFRSFQQSDKSSEDYLAPVNVYAIVFRDGLLTFTFHQNQHCANVRRRIARLRDHLSLSSDWVCYALIDDIVDSFGPAIHEAERQTDAIEDEVFTARSEDSRQILRGIGSCRKRVMSLLRLLSGKADVIKGFAKRCNEHYSIAPRGDVGLYLSDIQDHVVTMMSNLGHCERVLSRSHSNYLAQLSVDNLMQGNQVSLSVSKVTIVATILVPLNLITGLFGMNVPVPGRESVGLAWFFSIIGSIVVFVVLCLLLMKRLRYI